MKKLLVLLLAAWPLVSCTIDTQNYYVKVKITQAYVYGNRLSVWFDPDPDFGFYDSPIFAPGLKRALRLDNFHVVGVDPGGRDLILDGAPAPGVPAALTLSVDTSADLGRIHSAGSTGSIIPFGGGGASDAVNKYFSFAADQPATMAVPSPVFLVIPHPGTTNIWLMERDLTGNEMFAYAGRGIPYAAHTTLAGEDVFSFSMSDLGGPVDTAVYVRVGAPVDYYPDSRPFLTSTGVTTALLTPFQDGVNYAAGTVLTIDNCRYTPAPWDVVEY